MGFIWQDIIALAGAFFGAWQSSRLVPEFPYEIYMARFANGIHISIVIVLFGILATPSVDFMKDVAWVKEKLDFSFPLIGYEVFVLMGMTLFFGTTLQTILTKIKTKKLALNIVTLLMITVDLLVLIHILTIS